MKTLTGNRVVPKTIKNQSGANTIALDLLLNQNCSVTNNANLIVTGNISGSRGFTITGSGIMDLKGSNTYTGQTVIKSGTLKISDTATFGTNGNYAGFFLNNGTFDYSAPGDLTFSGNNDILSKTKPAEANPNPLFIMNGSGRLTWNFYRLASFFDGTIQVNSGYFRIGNGSTDGGTKNVKEIYVGSSGTLEFNRSDSYDSVSQSFILSGSGNIVLMNGSLTLAGMNTFNGTFTINSSRTLTLQRKLDSNFVNNGTLVLNVTTDYSYWDTTLANFSKTYNNNQTNYILSTDYSVSTNTGSGDITAQIQSAGFGDDISEFSGFVSGRIALVQRNSTSFQTKVNNAITAGASAVIIYNNTTGLFTPSLTSSSVPVIGITQSIGEQILTDLTNGAVTANVKCPGSFVVFDRTISGSGSLTKSGSGTLALAGNNSFSGGTTISAGSLRLSNSNALGSSSATVSVASNTALELSGGITLARNLSITGTGVNSAGALRNISGNNTHDGSISITNASRINSDADTLTLGSSGTLTGNFNVVFGGSGDFVINKSLANGTITKEGSGVLTFNAANSYTSTTTVNAGTLKISGAGTFGSGAVTNNSSVVFETNDNSTIANSMSGTGSVIKNLNTKTIFTGSFSHTGTTTVNAGTFCLGSGGTTGGYSGSSGDIIVNSGALFEINRSNAATFNRNISGQGSFLISGSVSTTIQGNLNHTGTTTISAGSLIIGSAGTTGSITSDIINNSNITFSRSDLHSYSGSMSGTGTLTKTSGGTLVISGNNSFTGNTSFSAASQGVIRVGHANALGNSSATVSVLSGCAIELINGITFSRNLSSAGTGITSNGSLRNISGNNKFTGSYTMTAISRINCDSDTLTMESGTVSGAFALTVGGSGNFIISSNLTHGSSLTKEGSGSMILSGNNTYTGNTVISAGAVTATGSAPFGSGSSISNASSLILEMNDGSTITQGISGAGTLTKNLNTKTILTGTLSHTGTTTIAAGTLAIGSGGASGSTSGATGDFVISSGSILEINRSGSASFTRNTSGAGSLLVLGGGTLTFSGNSSHSGGTTISAGTLSFTTGSVSGDIINNATLQFNRADTLSYSGSVSGTGGLTKSGNGTLILSGNSSYSGSTSISGGALRVSSSNALGNSSVTIATNTALELAGEVVLSRNISFTGTGVSTGGAIRNISGDNTCSGSLTLTGSSRITCDAGTLTLDSSGTFTGSTSITFAGAGNINIQRPIAISTGAFTKSDSGTVVLSASNTYTGTTTLNGGITRFARTSSLYNGTTSSWTRSNIIVNSGATFAINVGGTNEFTTTNVTTLLTNLSSSLSNNGLRSGSFIGFDTTNSPSDFTISNNIANSTGTGGGAVGVTKLGSGTLVLSGTSTYTGATTVNAGTLKAGSASCFGTSTITINSGATLDKAGFNITNTIVNNGGTVID